MEKPLLAAALLALVACRAPNTTHTPGPETLPFCGDGVVGAGEQCDGSELAGASCQSLGFDTGQLTCDGSCRFATAACTRRCGNGVRDLGEACDGDAGLEACAAFGYPACSDTCELDLRHCLTPALELGPMLELTKGGPAVIADLPPKGPGDLVIAVPSFNRVEAFPWVAPQGFDAAASRKLSFGGTPVLADVCDANGDGALDVLVLNADGTLEQELYSGSGFTSQRVDGGALCPQATVLGRGNFGRGGRAIDVALQGCGRVVVVGDGVARRLDLADAGRAAAGDLQGDGVLDLAVVSADGAELSPSFGPELDAGTAYAFPGVAADVALGDLDGDGDQDVVAVIAGQVLILENTGASLAERVRWPEASPAFLAVVDVDLDGRPDVAFTAGDDVVVRRNRGAFLFSEHRLGAGAGARLSVSWGDVDGDGDLDVAVTVKTGADSTRTTVLKNRVR